MTGTPGMSDQIIGTGEGITADYQLVKSYGTGSEPQIRAISRPRPETIVIGVGDEANSDWTLLEQGKIRFATAPAEGDEIRAGFLFDVPVRFAEDRIDVSGVNFAAGEAPSIPLIELREIA